MCFLRAYMTNIALYMSVNVYLLCLLVESRGNIVKEEVLDSYLVSDVCITYVCTN